MILCYYSSSQFLAQVHSHSGKAVSYSSYSLLGAIMVVCMFFHPHVKQVIYRYLD